MSWWAYLDKHLMEYLTRKGTTHAPQSATSTMRCEWKVALSFSSIGSVLWLRTCSTLATLLYSSLASTTYDIQENSWTKVSAKTCRRSPAGKIDRRCWIDSVWLRSSIRSSFCDDSALLREGSERSEKRFLLLFCDADGDWPIRALARSEREDRLMWKMHALTYLGVSSIASWFLATNILRTLTLYSKKAGIRAQCLNYTHSWPLTITFNLALTTRLAITSDLHVKASGERWRW